MPREGSEGGLFATISTRDTYHRVLAMIVDGPRQPSYVSAHGEARHSGREACRRGSSYEVNQGAQLQLRSVYEVARLAFRNDVNIAAHRVGQRQFKSNSLAPGALYASDVAVTVSSDRAV
jgi:hypothetical protein